MPQLVLFMILTEAHRLLKCSPMIKMDYGMQIYQVCNSS
jgi:hypothetical protein